MHVFAYVHIYIHLHIYIYICIHISLSLSPQASGGLGRTLLRKSCVPSCSRQGPSGVNMPHPRHGSDSGSALNPKHNMGPESLKIPCCGVLGVYDTVGAEPCFECEVYGWG